MRATFTDSISSTEGWAYGIGQEVVVGSVFTMGEVPESYAKKWLASGLLVAVSAQHETTVAVARERATHPRRRTGQ